MIQSGGDKRGDYREIAEQTKKRHLALPKKVTYDVGERLGVQAEISKAGNHGGKESPETKQVSKPYPINFLHYQGTGRWSGVFEE